MKKFINKIKYYFYRTRSAFCNHRWFYEWGVAGVDRHGLFCVKCKMRWQGIAGRKLRLFKYEVPPDSEMNEDKTSWLHPRKLKSTELVTKDEV